MFPENAAAARTMALYCIALESFRLLIRMSNNSPGVLSTTANISRAVSQVKTRPQERIDVRLPDYIAKILSEGSMPFMAFMVSIYEKILMKTSK